MSRRYRNRAPARAAKELSLHDAEPLDDDEPGHDGWSNVRERDWLPAQESDARDTDNPQRLPA